MLALKNGRILTADKVIEGKSIIIDNAKILDICGDIPTGIETIDARGCFISPGFIDIHIHGAGGFDTMDGTADSINNISKIIARHGVTSFLPTTMTVATDKIKRSVQAIKKCMEDGTDGANVLGAHLEGPYINEKTCRAQDPKYIIKPDINSFIDLMGNDFSAISRITVAPEVDGALDFIRFIVGHGILTSVGHSNGTYDEVMKSIGCGISHSTHLFNAMNAFNHREPGVVGAIFDSRISTEMIADGIHLHFAAIRTALAVKGCENCALISDSMQAACMNDGKYSLGGQDVYVKDGAARLADGTLAGSLLTLDTAVRNVLKNTHLNMTEAVSMVTSVPARIVRVNDRKGSIKPGYDADLVIFDSDINVKNTIIAGKVVGLDL